MNTQLLLDGLKAMILGMAMVYLFLIIMIWIMNLTAKLLKPYANFLEPKKAAPKKSAAKQGLSDKDLANAAISAVQTYISGKKSGAQSVNVPVNGKNIAVTIAPAGCNTPVAAVPAAAPAVSGNAVEIKSPLPGTITRIEVAEGDTVAAGTVLAVIEAMKMETEIRAENAGKICGIYISAKDVVAPEQVLMAMEVEK